MGPSLVDEVAIPWIVDQGADKVGGEKIGRKLNALKTRPNARSQRSNSQGLGQARNAFQKHVAVAQQPREETVNELFLADDDLADF